MKTFSKPFHELGGVFVDYKANRARAAHHSEQRRHPADRGRPTASKKPIQLPAGARVSNATWSPDSSGVAFFVHGEDATHIWFADVATGKARQLTKTPVLATLVTTFEFSEDGKTDRVRPGAGEPRRDARRAGRADRADGEARRCRPTNRLRTFPSLMSTRP